MSSPVTRLEDGLIQELLDNGTLHSELTRQLALNLQKERRESARLSKAVLAMRALITEFVNKHDIPTQARDLVMSQTIVQAPGGGPIERITGTTVHGPLEGHNLTTPLIWLQNIFTWMEERIQ